MHFQYANLKSIKSLQTDSLQVRAYVFRIMPNIRESWNKAACFQWSNIAPEGCNERVMCLWNHLFCNATLLNKNDTLISFYEPIPYLTIHISNAGITQKKKKWFQRFSSFSFTKLKMCVSQARGSLLQAFLPFTQHVLIGSIPLPSLLSPAMPTTHSIISLLKFNQS